MKLLDDGSRRDLYKVGNVIKWNSQAFMVISLSDDSGDDCKYGLLCLNSGSLACGTMGKIAYDSLPELAESCGSVNDKLLTGKVLFDMGD